MFIFLTFKAVNLQGRIKLSEKPLVMKKSDNNLFILDTSLNLKVFSYIQDKN